MNGSILLYALACQAAYSETIPENSPLRDRYDHVDTYRIKGASAFVAYNNERTDFLIVHRGSDQFRDLLYASASAIVGLGDKYFGPMVKLFNKIEKDFPELENELTNVVVAGHSWGGAIALLHAERIVADKCVTFGAPALFNLRMPKITGDAIDITRVVNGNDIVTHLVPGFPHYGKLVQIGETRRLPRLKDHFIKNYIANLK